MKLSEAEKNKLNEFLNYPAVQHIIGRGRHTIHRLVKEGTLDKIGYGRSARISLKSILDYLQGQREIAQVAATVPNTTLRKAADWARQKKHELKMKRALELVGTAGASATAERDPRPEAVVFEGVCMSRAEADAIQDQRFRASQPRRYSWASARGV